MVQVAYQVKLHRWEYWMLANALKPLKRTPKKYQLLLDLAAILGDSDPKFDIEKFLDAAE